AWPHRSPSHIERATDRHLLGHNHGLFGWSVSGEMVLIADAINLEIETVQVHCMVGIAGIDPAPMHWITGAEIEVLGVRPRFAIDAGQSVERCVSLGQPRADDEYAILHAGARRIDDECGHQHGIRASAKRGRMAIVAAPVIITTGRAYLKANFPHR